MESRPESIRAAWRSGRSLEGRAYDARRRRERLDRSRNFDRMGQLNGANAETWRGSKRQGRQHEDHCSEHGLIRILTTGHRAGHQSTGIVIAIFVRSWLRRRFRVVMLRNIAIVPIATSHRVTYPGCASQWSVQQSYRQQAKTGRENSGAMLTKSFHESSS